MISNRKGRLSITKELYESKEVDNALFGLLVKVFKVDYEPFTGVYHVYFTSPYCRESDESLEVVEYLIEISTNGYMLKESK